MLIVPSFKKSLIVEQFQGNYLNTVFQILLRISQSNGKNENSKTDISALKSVFGFRVRLEIRNPESGFPNLTHPKWFWHLIRQRTLVTLVTTFVDTHENTNMATIAIFRAETTASVASSFEQLHPKAKQKQKDKAKETSDPLKVLDPARKKLTSVEAQRVIAVVDDSIKRLELVSLLPYIIENLNRFSVILGSELVQVLVEHDRLQSSYQKAISKFTLDQKRSQSASPTPSNVLSRRSSEASQATLKNEDVFALRESRQSSAGSKQSTSLKQGPLSPLEQAHQDETLDLKMVQALSAQMKHSVRTIMRLFASNPAAVNSLKDLRNERSMEVNGMIDEITTLRAILFEKLLTTPSEKKERKQYLKQIVAREMKSRESGRKLQEELKRAIDDKENEVKCGTVGVNSLPLSVGSPNNKTGPGLGG